MEKSRFLYGAIGLLALGLTACSDDSDLKVKDQIVENDESRFIAITLSAPTESTTRAFENGLADESKVFCLDFIYYDINGNPTGKVSHLSETDLQGENVQFTENTSGNNVTRFCTSVVPVELVQGDYLPAQVICIVNGDTETVNRIATKPLLTSDDDENGFRDITQQEFTRSGNFLMTNSVYYGQDILTGQSNQRLCATPINANSQLFGSRTEALNAITAASATGATNAQKALLVDIYVERVAAKVSLTLDKANISAYVLDNGDYEAPAEGDEATSTPTVSLTFVPEYWMMNAVDKKTYLTKRYGVEVGGVIKMSPTYGEINGALTTAGFTDWNGQDPTDPAKQYHRSYWGTSPSYFKGDFPLVSDQIFDPEANPTTTYDPYTVENFYQGTTEKNLLVNYFSYNSIESGIANPNYSENRKQWRSVNENGSFANSVIYTRETTTPMKTINNDGATGNPAAAVGSAVIVGHYLVGNATEQSTFYIDRNNGDNGTFYGSMESARKVLLSRQSIIFTSTDGTNAVDARDLNDATLACFTVKHPEKAVRDELANPYIAGRLATLQLTTVPQTPLYYFDNTQAQYIQITETNLNKVNSQLVTAGYFDMYYNGLGFYTIPIRHLNWKDTSFTANANGVGGTYNWKTMKVAELGIVRNHSYYIDVKTIKGLADGIRSLDQPILPAKDAVNQYIAMKLNILAWNIGKSWDVNL